MTIVMERIGCQCKDKILFLNFIKCFCKSRNALKCPLSEFGFSFQNNFIFDQQQPNQTKLTVNFINTSGNANENPEIHTTVITTFLAWKYLRGWQLLFYCIFDKATVTNWGTFGGWYSAKWRNNSSWFTWWQPWE